MGGARLKRDWVSQFPKRGGQGTPLLGYIGWKNFPGIGKKLRGGKRRFNKETGGPHRGTRKRGGTPRKGITTKKGGAAKKG